MRLLVALVIAAAPARPASPLPFCDPPASAPSHPARISGASATVSGSVCRASSKGLLRDMLLARTPI
jgi:hypothetical protein